MVLSLLPEQTFAVKAATVTADQESNSFNDVAQSDKYYNAVRYVKANGIFAGTKSDTFTPKGSMTRGMFLTVLGRMVGVDASAYSGQASDFSDVSADAYYAPYVKWAAKYGITSGTGKGKFSPKKHVSRQQIAVFLVRYFEAFDVNYDTGTNITTTPADLDKVSPYARKAVLKLWKAGLLKGDGKNFNPKGDFTRAQAAMLCMRVDKAVETWYTEPGVPSERVRVELPKDKPGSATDTASGGSSTQYYEVSFAMGNEQEQQTIALPAKATYAKSTPISSLPTPSEPGMIFLGWYYDADMKNGVETDDTVQKNMTLYAKVAAGTDINGLETPNYVTVVDQKTDFTFQLSGTDSEDKVKEALTLTQVTVGDTEVEYTVTSTGNNLWTITPTLKEGQTYQAELKNDNVVFVLDGETQDSSVRFLNILTAKDETKNASLNPHLKQIKKADTSISNEVFNGLFQIDEQGASTQNNDSGTFTYSGQVAFGIGDTLAIVSGDVDLTDMTSDEGDVAYVKVIGVENDEYSYEMADVEDVLFMPDIWGEGNEARRSDLGKLHLRRMVHRY